MKDRSEIRQNTMETVPDIVFCLEPGCKKLADRLNPTHRLSRGVRVPREYFALSRILPTTSFR